MQNFYRPVDVAVVLLRLSTGGGRDARARSHRNATPPVARVDVWRFFAQRRKPFSRLPRRTFLGRARRGRQSLRLVAGYIVRFRWIRAPLGLAIIDVFLARLSDPRALLCNASSQNHRRDRFQSGGCVTQAPRDYYAENAACLHAHRGRHGRAARGRVSAQAER